MSDSALSPPPSHVYPRYYAREKLAAAIFLPIGLVFAIVPAHVWAQVASFSFGFAFFGQPLMKRGMAKFVELVPNWQDYLVLLDLRNSLLSRVPTDAQLTLHLLRERERQYDPLLPAPPPPTEHETKQAMARGGIAPEAGNEEGAALDAKAQDGDSGQQEDPSLMAKATAKGASKFLGGLRVFAKKAATFRGDVTVDGTRAKVGNKIDRFFYQSRAKDFNTLDCLCPSLSSEREVS
jgi:hypothetical protein